MSYWDLANKVESISFRLDSVKAIIELVAERIIDNPESSALWGCAEMLEIYKERLETISNEAMDLHKETKIEKPTTSVNIAKKGKNK